MWVARNPHIQQQSAAHCFVEGIKVACEISTSIWQKKLWIFRFEQFWVEICLKNFVCKIQNPDQSCRPNIDLKTWKIWKLNKDFKKVGPICGNLSYKSQLMTVWTVLNSNLPKKLPKEGPYWHFFSVKLMWKSHKQLLHLVQSSVCSTPVYYSILNSFGHRSQYISIKLYYIGLLFCQIPIGKTNMIFFFTNFKPFFSSSRWCQPRRSGSKCPSSPTGYPTATPRRWGWRRGWQPQGYSHAQNCKANTYCNSKKSTTTKYQ